MGEMGTYHMYGRAGADVPLSGMFSKTTETPAGWLLYVRVPDLDEVVATVKSAGGTILNGPMEVPDGDVVAQCVDPQGAAFALHASAS